MKHDEAQTPARAANEPVVQGEERFRLLVDSVQDYAIFMLDPQGRVLTWNLGAQRLKQYEASEIIGRSFEVFYPESAISAKWPQEELRRACETGRFEDEGWRVRKDGTLFWANVVLTALRSPDGVLQGFAKVTRDLTERRRQEDLLRRAEEQFRLLLESVKDYAIFMLDPTGHVLTWNAGAQAIKGYAAAEVLGRNFSMFFTSQDIQSGVPAEELATAARVGRAEREGWRVRKDGGVFWANAVITPVLDSDGTLRGYAKVTRDLSESRRLTDLESSSRRMTEFIAMLAHELRNPLAPIRNAVSILQVQSTLPPLVQRLGDIVSRQLSHLTRLVDDLLDVGRIVTGKISLKCDEIDYREVVQLSIESVRPLIEERRQRLVLDLPDSTIAMMGDATRLSQALQNLLQNATRYTPEGGEIRVALCVKGAAVHTAVSDTGIGIEPEAIERIFELFVQEPSSRPRTDGGLGIGLSLARTLVEQHGGMLSAESKGLGEGSTFTILIPLRKEAAGEPRPPTASGIHDNAPSHRVLVVDDSADSADTMVALLGLLGHEARSAYGAEQAVAVAQEFMPDIALLDLNMPDGDGFSVMKRLQAQSLQPIYIAAMTGYGQKRDRDDTLAAGFQAHLTKPVSLEQLQRTLCAVTGRQFGYR